MWTKMDKDGDRYARQNGKWVKVSLQADGKGYTVVLGWEGDFKCKPNGITKNHRYLGWAKSAGEAWITD